MISYVSFVSRRPFHSQPLKALLGGFKHELFPSLPLAETYIDSATQVIESLKSELIKIIPSLRVSEAPQDSSPLLELCLKSFYVKDAKGGRPVEKSFRIFGAIAE